MRRAIALNWVGIPDRVSACFETGQGPRRTASAIVEKPSFHGVEHFAVAARPATHSRRCSPQVAATRRHRRPRPQADEQPRSPTVIGPGPSADLAECSFAVVGGTQQSHRDRRPGLLHPAEARRRRAAVSAFGGPDPFRKGGGDSHSAADAQYPRRKSTTPVIASPRCSRAIFSAICATLGSSSVTAEMCGVTRISGRRQNG